MKPPRWAWRFFSEKKQITWACQDIREHLLFFGYDLTDLTDQQLVDSAIRMAGIVGQVGVTVLQAADAFSQVGRAMSEAQNMEDPGSRQVDNRRSRERGGDEEDS